MNTWSKIMMVSTIVMLGVAGSLAYWTGTGHLNGKDGLQGPQGIQGEQGIQGLIGKTGATGPKGDKGDTGAKGATGARGPTGSPGKAGKDAPVNQPPSITLVNISGYHNCYTFSLIVNVTDPDDTSLQITFFYSLDNHSWNQCDGTQFNTGIHSVQKTINEKHIDWLVEAWDGQDLTTQTYTYTIKKQG